MVECLLQLAGLDIPRFQSAVASNRQNFSVPGKGQSRNVGLSGTADRKHAKILAVGDAPEPNVQFTFRKCEDLPVGTENKAEHRRRFDVYLSVALRRRKRAREDEPHCGQAYEW